MCKTTTYPHTHMIRISILLSSTSISCPPLESLQGGSCHLLWRQCLSCFSSQRSVHGGCWPLSLFIVDTCEADGVPWAFLSGETGCWAVFSDVLRSWLGLQQLLYLVLSFLGPSYFLIMVYFLFFSSPVSSKFSYNLDQWPIRVPLTTEI